MGQETSKEPSSIQRHLGRDVEHLINEYTTDSSCIEHHSTKDCKLKCQYWIDQCIFQNQDRFALFSIDKKLVTKPIGVIDWYFSCFDFYGRDSILLRHDLNTNEIYLVNIDKDDLKIDLQPVVHTNKNTVVSRICNILTHKNSNIEKHLKFADNHVAKIFLGTSDTTLRANSMRYRTIQVYDNTIVLRF